MFKPTLSFATSCMIGGVAVLIGAAFMWDYPLYAWWMPAPGIVIIANAIRRYRAARRHRQAQLIPLA